MIHRNIRNFVGRIVKHTKLLLLLFDIIVLNLAFLGAVLVRFGSLDFPYQHDYLQLLLLGNVIWILLIGVFDAYKVTRFEPMETTLLRTIRMVFTHFPLFLLITYIIDFRDSSRLLLFVFLGFLLFGVIFYRIVAIAILKWLRRRGVNHKSVAIIGYNRNAVDIYDVLTSDIAYGYRVMGYFTDEKIRPGEIPFLGNLDSIEEGFKKRKIDEVYVALSTTNAKRVKNIFQLCDRYGVRVNIIPNFQKYTASHVVQIKYYRHVPVLRRRTEPLTYSINKWMKRLFDIVFSLVVILGLLWWIYPIVAIVSKLTSIGPVIFRQRRSGIDGKVFTCYKFRTMVENDTSELQGTQRSDPRITPFGRFLRKTKIDELPQFVNVLFGNMSVVGPRPHMLVHTEVYSELISEFMVRHYVKPGVTGWAQIVGELYPEEKLKEMKEKIKNDIWYIENWSFLLDLKIIINTTLCVFRGKDDDCI